MESRIHRGVVLAAGRGSRMRSVGPKPLVEVAGIPLLGWVLRALVDAGLAEVLVVGGDDPSVGRWVETVGRAWAAQRGATVATRRVSVSPGNAASLCAAADYVGGGAIVTMADHVYPPALVERVLAGPRGARLAVDRDVASCVDLADATKVRCRGGRVAALGKGLDPFDALDCGVFAVDEAWVEEARAATGRTLSDIAPSCSPLHVVDVTGVPWLDVDSPELLRHAQGWWSRHAAWFRGPER